jgi:hypothetical protein
LPCSAAALIPLQRESKADWRDPRAVHINLECTTLALAHVLLNKAAGKKLLLFGIDRIISIAYENLYIPVIHG